MNTIAKTTTAGLAAAAIIAIGASMAPSQAHANSKVFGAAFVGGLLGTAIANSASHGGAYYGPTHVHTAYPTCYWTTQTYWQYGVQYTRQVQVCN